MRDRFQVVLRVRKVQEQLLQARAADAERALRAAASEHTTQAREHAQRATTAVGLTPLQLRSLQLQGLGSYAQLAAAAHAEDEARTSRDTAAVQQTGASVRRRSAERLLERRQDALAAVVARDAQRTLDELAVARWRNR